MASPLDPSREATPSSTSSQGMSNDFPSSHSASGSSQGQNTGTGEDVDRFLKRMDMEKKLQALQQRLELASMKATNGWTDMSMGEIEDKLPAPPPRRRSSVHPVPAINLEGAAAASASASVASSSRTPYEPPSPSRPWQLMDVLWQPLPPPSRGPMSPVSPSSPSVQRRRSKREDLMVDVHGHHAFGSVHGSNGNRRASSAAMMAYLGHDPYPVQSGGRVRKEKRSQSHSITTTQDVDAAKALTAMLGGGGGSPRAASPFSPGTPPPRHRSASVQRRTPSTAPPRSQAQRRANSNDSMEVDPALASATGPETKRGEEDTDAAELMMFLAHSPSAAGARRYSPSLSEASIGKTARVLFADGPASHHGHPSSHSIPEPPKQPMGSSNLALAPPITAGSLMRGMDDA